MTAHVPVTAARAVMMVEAIGVADARQFLADKAACSLLKSYAEMIETRQVGGSWKPVQGSAVEPELWKRIIDEDATDDVWDGGTVRLASSDLIGGCPAVNLTGIGFKASDLDRVIATRRGAPPRRPSRPNVAAPSPQVSPDEPATSPKIQRQRKAPDLTRLHSGALLLTVDEACAALARGRTHIYKLIGAGELVRPAGDTRVTAESVRRCAGLIR